MNSDFREGLLIGIVIGAVLVLIGHLMDEAFGENYKYNLSESELADEWITQACMKFSINSAECDLVYGGVMDAVSEGKIK